MESAVSITWKQVTDAGAAGPATSDTPTMNVKCSLCPELFSNLPEALKHELSSHMGKKRSRRPHQTKIITKSALDRFEADIVNSGLSPTTSEGKLAGILKLYCMDEEKLDVIYSHIEKDLQMELEHLRGMKLNPFGSIASGLALKDCDIDIYMELNPKQRETFGHTQNSIRWVLKAINNSLRRSKCFTKVYVIRHARVPIAKCLHINTGYSIDINVSSPSSVHNTRFLRSLVTLDKRIYETMLFIKIWAKKRSLIGSNGNMNSYCLAIMALFYLQQPRSNGISLLPSIKQMQAQMPAHMIQGVNYAHNLETLTQALPAELTTPELLHGLFDFYANFDFENCIASPYLGAMIPIDDFRSSQFKFIEYENQLRAIDALKDSPAEPFQLESSMRVQDPFALNHNVAKSIHTYNLKYFRKCLVQALQTFTETSDLGTNNGSTSIYESLLNNVDVTSASRSKMEPLTYRLVPRRAELQALASNASTVQKSETYHDWIQHYIVAINVIISQVYLLQMEEIKDAVTTNIKHKKRPKSTDSTCAWRLRGHIDMWTGRIHKRNNNQTFLECQLAQTFEFIRQRLTQPSFAVEFDGILTMDIVCNHTAMQLRLEPATPLGNIKLVSKKDPLRKFFNIFKNSMQNFNIIEKIKMNEKWTANQAPITHSCNQ